MTDYKKSHVQLGKLGEQFVMDTLAALGIVARYGTPGDILTGQISIEVKTARPNGDAHGHLPRFQFCINRWEHTRFRSDFLVLVFCTRNKKVFQVYVIPGCQINGNKKIAIPESGYAGRWLEYLEAWQHILTHPGVEYER